MKVYSALVFWYLHSFTQTLDTCNMSYLELNWLWDEKFWFPPNITWDQFETSGNAR